MTGQSQSTTVGAVPNTTSESTVAPVALTRAVWLLWAVSLGVLVAHLRAGGAWEIAGLFRIDGLTVLMWVVVTFFSGIVHSYARRYMAGSERIDRFFGGVFAFTLSVATLVAADHVALFAAAWLAMGLTMADLIGHAKGWSQAQAAASLARRSFLASTGLVALALGTLAWATGSTTISGILAGLGGIPTTTVLLAAAALVLAALVQSALFPFHTWLLSSMTAPTPASALMHAGFVNAGGLLLTRFAPVVTVDATLMLAVAVLGALSALLGKLLKSVQPDVKRGLGCSTVGQMGFMVMQAGLGFFGAAVTHLILHGFYKAYQFLSTGEQVEQTSPGKSTPGSAGVLGVAVTILAGLAGGAVFAALTGKGAHLDTGLLLALIVVLTTMQATRSVLAHTALPATLRYGAIPVVFLPAVAGYALVYQAITGVLAGLPLVTAPAELSVVHVVLAGAFTLAYLAIETGYYRDSERLYVTLLNIAQPPSATVLTATEDYNEY